VIHNNNKHTNSARKFLGDFANFQKISRSVRQPASQSTAIEHTLSEQQYWPQCSRFTENCLTTLLSRGHRNRKCSQSHYEYQSHAPVISLQL